MKGQIGSHTSKNLHHRLVRHLLLPPPFHSSSWQILWVMSLLVLLLLLLLMQWLLLLLLMLLLWMLLWPLCELLLDCSGLAMKQNPATMFTDPLILVHVWKLLLVSPIYLDDLLHDELMGGPHFDACCKWQLEKCLLYYCDELFNEFCVVIALPWTLQGQGCLGPESLAAERCWLSYLAFSGCL